MSSLICSDYGYECDFEVDGEDELVIPQFGEHVHEEHGIEYSWEILMKVILRKGI